MKNRKIMRFIVSMAASAGCMILVSACGNANTEYNDILAENEDLKAQIEELQSQIEELQSELDTNNIVAEVPVETAQEETAPIAESGEIAIDSSISDYITNPTTSDTFDISTDSFAGEVIVETKTTRDGYLGIFLKNNGAGTIGTAEVNILYKDSSGQTVATEDYDFDLVMSGATVAGRVDIPDSYDSIVVEIEAEDKYNMNQYNNHYSDVQLKTNLGTDSNVIIEITNNSDEEIEHLSYIVIMYDGDEISCMRPARSITDLSAGKTTTEEESYLYGYVYDSYNVILNKAYSRK